MENRMKYRIAEFANMIGLEPSKIRYYEKKGVYQHVRNENGYRVFEKEDAFVMNEFQALTCRGYSIKESTRLLQGQTIQDAITSLGNNVIDMEKELLLLTEKKKYAEETIALYQKFLENPQTIIRGHFENYYVLPASLQGDFTITQKNAKTRDYWQKFIPITRYIGFGQSADLFKDDASILDYGNAVLQENFIRLEFPGDETVELFHLGECICFFCNYTEEEQVNLKNYPFIKEYLEENHLEVRDQFLFFFFMMQVFEMGKDAGIMILPVRKIK